jgi:protein transport protein SEC23
VFCRSPSSTLQSDPRRIYRYLYLVPYFDHVSSCLFSMADRPSKETPGTQRGPLYQGAYYMQVVNYPPITCKSKDCGAAISPFAAIDYGTKMWVCPLCATRNYFPSYYAEISPEHLPAELFQTSTTIEYTLPVQHAQFPPVYIFIVDTAVSEDELEACKTTLMQALQMMPEDSLIGLVSFGTHIHVHELQHSTMPKVFVFRGTGDFTPSVIATQLGFKSMARQQQQLDGLLASKFLVSLEEAEYQIEKALESLQPDAYQPVSDHRKSRCTGTAIQVAAGLAETGVPCNTCPVRLMLFVGGPCTEGVSFSQLDSKSN